MFDAVDQNRSGKIEFSDYLNWMLTMTCGSSTDKQNFGFDLCDLSKDGSLTFEELKVLIQSMFHVLTSGLQLEGFEMDAFVELMMKKIDCEGTNCVTRAQWQKACADHGDFIRGIDHRVTEGAPLLKRPMASSMTKIFFGMEKWNFMCNVMLGLQLAVQGTGDMPDLTDTNGDGGGGGGGGSSSGGSQTGCYGSGSGSGSGGSSSSGGGGGGGGVSGSSLADPKNGILTKLSQKSERNWKKRYFVLDGSQMAYYKWKEGKVFGIIGGSERHILCGTVTLTRGSQVLDKVTKDGKRNVFQIVTPGKSMFVAAETDAEATSWVVRIRQTIAHIALQHEQNRDGGDAEAQAEADQEGGVPRMTFALPNSEMRITAYGPQEFTQIRKSFGLDNNSYMMSLGIRQVSGVTVSDVSQ
jgi:hypothetical protein